MNSSPERGTFHRRCAVDRAVEDGRDPSADEDVQRAFDIELMIRDSQKAREANPEWQKNNLEYDLRNTPWICDKVKASDTYAQNLYAALCNQDWQKNDVWPLLKGETYSCSWRYAGGIVADMQEKGDYINWYCSGIGEGLGNGDADGTKGYVGESVVTDEIREDLLKLGWIPKEWNDDGI